MAHGTGEHAVVPNHALRPSQRRLLEDRLLALKTKSLVGALGWQNLRRLADLWASACCDLLLQELVLELELRLLLSVEEELAGSWVGWVEATALSVVLVHWVELVG